MKWLRATFTLFALLAAVTPATAEFEDRLPPDRIDQIVSGPIGLVKQGRLADGESLLVSLRGETDDALARADLTEAFGVSLYVEAEGSDETLMRASARYLWDAIEEYRMAVGARHPEVALALVSFADVARQFTPDDPPPLVEASYREALFIRAAIYGKDAPITLSTLVPLATAISAPAHLKRNPDVAQQAEGLLRALLDTVGEATDSDSESIRYSAQRELVRLQLRTGRYDDALAGFKTLSRTTSMRENELFDCIERGSLASEMRKTLRSVGRAADVDQLGDAEKGCAGISALLAR